MRNFCIFHCCYFYFYYFLFVTYSTEERKKLLDLLANFDILVRFGGMTYPLVIENFGFIGFVRDFEIWIIVGLGCLENP
jgi:hypothetical protein